MKRVFLIAGCMLITACVENLIHITVLPTGEYSIKYNSVGNKEDLENRDFLHPENINGIKWSSKIITRNIENDFLPDSLNWEKETIITEPISGKISFTNNESLVYDIDVNRSGYFFWETYRFTANINSLAIDDKYPSIVQFLDIEADSLSWIAPAKQYIIKTSLEKYDDKVNLNTIFTEKINNQINSYFEYAIDRRLIEKFDRDSSIILKDALKPIASTLPNNFFKEMTILIDAYEKDFKRDTALMNDYFQFNINLPGVVRSNNANSISDDVLVWSFDFDDIAKDEFKMYANSIRINKFRVQLALVISMVGFLGILWNQRLKKK